MKTKLTLIGEQLCELFNSDPFARARLKPHAKKVFSIERLVKTPLFIAILSSGELLWLERPSTSQLIISGEFKDFQALLSDKDAHLEIKGDMRLAQDLQTSLRDIEPDWVALLSPWIGPKWAETLGPHVPAEQLYNKVQDWLDDYGSTFSVETLGHRLFSTINRR